VFIFNPKKRQAKIVKQRKSCFAKNGRAGRSSSNQHANRSKDDHLPREGANQTRD